MPTHNEKDPSARLLYPFDWRNPAPGQTRGWLDEDETIASYTVEVTKGDAVIDGVTEVGGVVKAWVKAGTAGTTAWVTCHIVTSTGAIDERTKTLSITQR